MIALPFDYARATSLDDALAKLAASNGAGKFIAGGHSLVPLMKLRLSEPKVLIDIARIPDLSGIREIEHREAREFSEEQKSPLDLPDLPVSSRIEIRSGTVHHDVASSTLLREQCPAVSDAAGEIGDPQVRNRGTIGGTLAHADPAADYPAVMLAVDAEIHMKGPKGWRTVKARDFFQDLFTVDLAPDEIIAGVQFGAARASAYAKLHQRASHFAIVGVAAALDVSGGTIQSARIGLTGAGPSAVRLTKVEEALAGKAASKETIAAAAEQAGAELPVVNSDIHASAEYRRAMIPVFTRRALEAALGRV